jgi:WD40 repeat protein
VTRELVGQPFFALADKDAATPVPSLKLAWRPGATYQIASADADGKCRLWDVESRRLVRTFEAPHAASKDEFVKLTQLAFAPDGKTLYFAPAGHPLLRRWNVDGVETPETIRLPTGDGYLRALAIGADGHRLALSAVRTYLWDTHSRQYVQTIMEGVNDALAFSPDGRYLALLSKQGVGLWDVRAQKLALPGRMSVVEAQCCDSLRMAEC